MNPIAGRAKNSRGQGGRLRAELVSAARRLAETAGTTDGLSLRAVAREVGVAPNSVYLHFRDREDIFRAALVEDYDRLAEHLQAAQTSGDPFENLRRVAGAYCAFATDHPASYRLIVQVVQAIPEGGPRPDGHSAAALQSMLLNAIQRCIDAGARTRSDADMLLAILWSALHGFLDLRASKPQREWPRVGDFIEQLVAALLPPSQVQTSR